MMKATWKPMDAVVGNQKVHLLPGDFIFGRKRAAVDLAMTEREIRTCLEIVKKWKNVTIKTTNKFSIISIVNWNLYQQDENQNDQQSDQQPANNLPTKCHIQEVKNINIKEKRELPLPDFISDDVWQSFKAHRKTLKAPLTEKACSLIFNKLEKWKNEKGCSPDDVLNQSIENGWRGIFELSGNGNNGNKDNKPKTTDSGRYRVGKAEDLINKWANEIGG